MASNSESSSQEQPLSDFLQKASSIDASNVNNANMTDENRDPTSSPLPTKPRPKPIDARSAASSPFTSSLDSPKSATITNVSQRLPSTSVEVSVGDILSTGGKRASVSIREDHQQAQQQQQHSSSSCSSSEFGDTIDNTLPTMNNKMDLGEATRELTRLLHIGNDSNIHEVHLNPDAPDFTPIDFSPTYRSELAPAHLNRRATQLDYYNNRQSRSRYYSESYHSSMSNNTSTIRPLLSLIPQYVPYHRQSWTTTTPGPNSSSSSNSWWQQDYGNPPSSTTSYHSKPAYPFYSPLMPPLTDDSLYPTRNSSKRQRIHSNRAFVFPNSLTLNRKRSHSGPETPLEPPPSHLNGIHSLTKIMIDLLRMIDPLPIKEQQEGVDSRTNILSADSYSSPQRKYRRPSNPRQRRSHPQRCHESIDVEDVFEDEQISTITTSVMADEQEKTDQTTDTSNIISGESFYEVSPNDES